MAPFIAFLLGAYLSDVNDAPDGARTAAGILGTLFLLCFLMCNIQACIITAIIAIIATIAFMLIMMYLCTASDTSTNQSYKR